MNDFTKEIGEMNKALNFEIITDDEDQTQDQDLDQKLEDDQTPDDQTQDAPEPTEAPETSPAPTEPPPTEPPDERDKLVMDLRRRIEELEGERKKKEEEAPKPTKPPPTESPLSFDEVAFLGDYDSEDLLRDPNLLNKLANEIYQRSVTDARRILGESVLRSIPDLVKNNVTILAGLKEAADEFYARNEDLRPFKRTLAAVFEEVSSDNPGMKFDKLMDKVETVAREKLGLYKKAADKTEPRSEGVDNSPKLHGKRGGGKRQLPQNKKPNSILSEIDRMNESLGR